MSISDLGGPKSRSWARRGAGLGREAADWHLSCRAVGEAKGADHGDRADGMKAW